MPCAAGDGLLQRWRAGLDLGRRLHIQTDGQARIEPGGKTLDVDRFHAGVRSGKVDVEVLAERFVAGGQRQPEAQLGMRGESLCVGHRKGGPSQRALPDASDVTMAGEADLPQLREPDADFGVRDQRAHRTAAGAAPPDPIAVRLAGARSAGPFARVRSTHEARRY